MSEEYMTQIREEEEAKADYYSNLADAAEAAKLEEQVQMMNPAERLQLEEQGYFDWINEQDQAEEALKTAIASWEEQQARSAEDGA